MSYKLINANNIAFNSDGFITEENIGKMPCIYADLPNGMDGEHYVLEQEPKIKVIDKIKAEIEQFADAYCSGDDINIYDVFQIIDKYKAESEDKKCVKNI